MAFLAKVQYQYLVCLRRGCGRPGLCQSEFAEVCSGIQSLGELLPIPDGANSWVSQLPMSSASASLLG